MSKLDERLHDFLPELDDCEQRSGFDVDECEAPAQTRASSDEWPLDAPPPRYEDLSLEEVGELWEMHEDYAHLAHRGCAKRSARDRANGRIPRRYLRCRGGRLPLRLQPR